MTAVATIRYNALRALIPPPHIALPQSTQLTFLLNDYGKPFASAAALGNKFADWCDAAG